MNSSPNSSPSPTSFPSASLPPQAAIRAVLDAYPHHLVISTCGYTTRDLASVSDDKRNFYMVGSMGAALPFGLGVAEATPGVGVLVLDGDGSALMGLGAMAMVAERSPANFIHVVLNNGIHESTGGQQTVALSDWPAIALSLGYRAAHRVTSLNDVMSNGAMNGAMTNADGPTLLEIPTERRTDGPAGRVRHSPAEIVKRFREHLDLVTIQPTSGAMP